MSNESSLVSVVVVNYNGSNYLPSCLHSLLAQTHKPAEIIVVDNGSSDGAFGALRQNFPSVNVIRNSENRFLCAAYNQGIAVSKGDYILCLNNDVTLSPSFIELLLEKRNISSRVGIWGGKLVRPDKQTIDSAGLWFSRNRKPFDRGYNQRDRGQYQKEGYVFGINGAAMLLRRTMLEVISINGECFDEDFKVFYEDFDLCWRANRFGWKAYYVPEAIAYHARGAATQKNNAVPRSIKKFYLPHLSSELQAHYVKNRYATILKNDALPQFLKHCLFIIFYDSLLWGYLVLCKPKTVLLFYHNKGIFKKSIHKRALIEKKLSGRNT